MSSSGLSQTYQPNTLDGLNVLEADQIYIDGQLVNLDNYVTYTGANKTVNLGSQNIQTTHNPTLGPDLINLTTLTDAVTYVDTANALTYLNKVTATEQNVAAATTFSSTVTANYFYTDNSYNWGRPSSSYNAWAIGRILNSGVIRDLQFKDDTAGVTALLLSSTGQTVYVGLTCNYATGSKIPIFDSDRKLVSSGVDSIKITYLDNVSSDIQTQLNARAVLAGGNSFSGSQNYSDKTASSVAIFDGSKNLVSSAVSTTELNYIGGLTSGVQTQLNGKLSLTGGSLSGALSMGANKVTSSSVPSVGDDLTNKTYVDGAISGAGALYVLKTGSTVTGDLTLSNLTANRVLILDASKNIKTSSITTTELGNLTGSTSSIQSQLDAIFSTIPNFVSKFGSTMTGTLYNTGGNFHPYKGGDMNKGVYLFANNADGATYDTYNGGLGSWNGIGFFCSNDSTTRFIFNTRDGTSSQTGAHTCGGLTSSGDVTVNATLTAYSLVSNSWARADDYRDGMNPFQQSSSSMGFYFGTHSNNGDAPFSDLLCLNSWSDSSAGNVNLLSINKGGKGIRQYQGTFASKTNFSTYYDCVMTEANSPNVIFNGSVGIGTNALCSLYNFGAGTTGWKGMSYFGNENTGVVAGCYDNKAYLGGHNGSLSAWTDVYLAPAGNVSVGLATPTYRLSVQGDVSATGSLIFGLSGTYTSGCIFSDSNYACIIRSKISSPAIDRFLWSDATDIHQMRITKYGVLTFTGGGTTGSTNAATTAGAITIGSSTADYSTGWTAGLLMECSETTGITIHDSNEKLASFMFYDTDNRFHMGSSVPGWGTTAFTFESDLTCNANITAEQFFTNGWFRVNNNNNGLYWQNLGRGIQSPEGAGNTYGTISTYGSGRNTWNGYGLQDRYCFMKYGGSDQWGIHDNSYSWLILGQGGATRDVTISGVARFSRDYDRLLMYANATDTSGGYFYYNQGNVYGTISDRRIKRDFLSITEEQSIAFIKALEPTSFCLKDSCCQTTLADGVEVENIGGGVCSCRQDGWVAQNVLEACHKSGASKSVINHWYDYEQELEKPEEERTTLIGVSDRPILSHTVNVVKVLMAQIDTLTQRNEVLEAHARQQEKAFTDYKKDTDKKIEKLASLIGQLMSK